MPGPSGTEVGAVTIRVSPDTSKFRRELERELKAIAKGVEIKIPVKLDAKGVNAQLAAMKKNLASLSGVNIKVGADSKELDKDLKSTVTSAVSLRSLFGKITESIKSSRDGVKDMQERLKSAAGTAHVIATQNPLKTISQGAKNLGKNIADADLRFKNLRKSGVLAGAGIAAGFVLAGKAGRGFLDVATLGVSHFGQMSRIMKIVVASIVAMPAAIGVVSGLLAGLPSLLFATAAGIGVIALGMDGIKAAGERFGKVIAPLRESISKIFEKRLGDQLAGFGNALNKMKPQLEAVTNGLLDMSQGFFDTLTSAKGMEQMKSILTDTAGLFRSLKPAVENFTGGFLNLAVEGAKNFDLLSGVINKFATSFKQMTDRMIASGGLRDMFKGLAAVTDSLLQGFLKLFGAGAKALAELGGPLAGFINSFVDVIVDLMPMLTEIAKLFLNVGKAILDALRPAIAAISPVIQSLAGVIQSAIVPAIQAFAPVLELAAKFVGELLVALKPLFPVLLEVARVFADILLAALTALKPVLPIISDFISELAKMITTGLGQAAPVLTQIATTIGQVLATGLKAVMPLLMLFLKTFMELFQALLPVLDPLLQMVNEILPPLAEILFTLAKPALDFAVALTKFLVPALTWVIGIVKDVILWFFELVKGLIETGKNVFKWFADLPNKIWDLVKGAARWLFDTGKRIIQGLIDGLVNVATDIWNFFRGLPRRILDAVGDAAQWLYDTGKKIIQGMVRGILDAVPALRAAMGRAKGEVTGGVFQQFQINSPSRVMIPLGKFITEGLAVGMEKGIPLLDEPIQKMADHLQGQAVGLSTSIEAAGEISSNFDRLDAAVERALSGWSVKLDEKGLAKMVRNADLKNRNGRTGGVARVGS